MSSKKIKIGVGIGVFVIAITVFTFADLSVSKLLYNPMNSISIFLERFGGLPTYLIASFCSAALVVTRDRAKKVVSVGNIIGFGLTMIMFAIFAGLAGFSDGDLFLSLPTICISLFYVVIFIFINYKLSRTQCIRKQYQISQH